MDTLVRLDTALFRWINRDLGHPALDWVMSQLSSSPVWTPAVVILGCWLVWKGGARGVVFVLVAAAAAGLANEFVVEPLKDGVQRLRPYAALDGVVLRVGKGNSMGSMPSAHALNMFLLATVSGWYYPRALWVTLPLAAGVGVSRVYNGAHYPGDVLAGAFLGCGVGVLTLWGADRLWRWAGPRWAPRWFARIRSLLHPEQRLEVSGGALVGRTET